MNIKKITLATFKSFVRKNIENLEIKIRSTFDGSIDCVSEVKDQFRKAPKSEKVFLADHNLGIAGVWLVGSSRDYFSNFENDTHLGYEVNNCCGSFILALKKGETHE